MARSATLAVCPGRGGAARDLGRRRTRGRARGAWDGRGCCVSWCPASPSATCRRRASALVTPIGAHRGRRRRPRAARGPAERRRDPRAGHDPRPHPGRRGRDRVRQRGRRAPPRSSVSGRALDATRSDRRGRHLPGVPRGGRVQVGGPAPDRASTSKPSGSPQRWPRCPSRASASTPSRTSQPFAAASRRTWWSAATDARRSRRRRRREQIDFEDADRAAQRRAPGARAAPRVRRRRARPTDRAAGARGSSPPRSTPVPPRDRRLAPRSPTRRAPRRDATATAGSGPARHAGGPWQGSAFGRPRPSRFAPGPVLRTPRSSRAGVVAAAERSARDAAGTAVAAGDRQGRQGRVVAGERVRRSRRAAVCPSQSGEVAGGCAEPLAPIREARVDVREQRRERGNVRLVVAHDLDEGVRDGPSGGSRGTARGSPSSRRPGRAGSPAAPAPPSAAARPRAGAGRSPARARAGRGAPPRSGGRRRASR